MKINFKNYFGSVAENSINIDMNNAIQLLMGATNSTIVKTLELINNGESCTVNVIRKDESNTIYSNITLDMKSNDYLILWQGFFVIPSGHKILFNCTSTKCKIVANVVEMIDETIAE